MVWIVAAISAPVFGVEQEKSFDLRFGILSEPKPRKYLMKEETTKIPRYFIPTGFRFGYLIREKNLKPFRLETITYPPSPPKTLGDAYTGQDPSEGLRATPRELNGHGASGMGFDPGDPTGEWKIEFYIDGKLYRTVEFTVYEPTDLSKPN